MNVSIKETRLLVASILLTAGILSACSFAGVQTGASNPQPADRGAEVGRLSRGESRSLTVRLASGADVTTIEAQLNTTVIDVITVGANRYARLDVPATSVDEAILLARSLPAILAAEQTIIYDHFLSPDDGSYALQYAPQLTGLETVWSAPAGELDDTLDPVVVAVIDSGVNTVHEDLIGRVVTGRDTVGPGSSAYNVGQNLDDDGHGTHVAGIIAATGNNAVGIAGVTWQADIMPIRSLGLTGGSDIDVAEGVVWAVDNGANIINMSLGGVGASIVLADAVNYALANNVTVIAAAGNDGRDQINYPAAFPGVIAVGSTDSRDQVSSFSTRGEHLSVAAPGEDIWSLDAFDNGGYLTLDGTSMATPFVSGVAALLMQKHGTSLTPGQIRGILEATAEDLGAAGYDDEYGHGRVDPVAAFAANPAAFSDSYSGTILVDVMMDTTPLTGHTVVLLSNDGSTLLSVAITSDGNTTASDDVTTVATAGRAYFRGLDPAGTYQIRTNLLGEQRALTGVSPSPTPANLTFLPTTRPILVDTQWVFDSSRDFETPTTDGFDDVRVTLELVDSSLNTIASAVVDPNFPDTAFEHIYPSITTNLLVGDTFYVVLTDVVGVPANFVSGNINLVVSTDTTTPLPSFDMTGAPQPSVAGLTSFTNSETLTVGAIRYLRKSVGQNVFFSFVVPSS